MQPNSHQDKEHVKDYIHYTSGAHCTVQQFLLFTSLFCQFTQNFCSLVASLTTVNKKSLEGLKWSRQPQQGFVTTKERQKIGPLVHMPDMSPNL